MFALPRFCAAILSLALSGCAGMPTLETVTVTPGASTTQQIESGKRIYTVGGTVGFQFRIPHREPVRPRVPYRYAEPPCEEQEPLPGPVTSPGPAAGRVSSSVYRNPATQ